MNILEYVYLVFGYVIGNDYETEIRIFGVFTTIEMAFQVKAYKEEEYFEKFKKAHPDVTIGKENFECEVMMVPIDKASNNKIGEYFE